MWFIVALFAILTIILLSGKGGFLIAGYNTSSKKKKAEYNETKLSRVMGGGTGIITILLAIRAILGNNTPYIFDISIPILILIVSIVMIVLSNTICKDKNRNPIANEKESDWTKKITNYTWVFVVLILVAAGVLLMTGDINVSFKQDSLYIEGSYWPNKTIEYKDIQSVTYKEDIKSGVRTNGLGSFKLNEGHFKNKQFGRYILYSYVKCKSFIVLKTDSDLVVINAKTENDTKKLYEKMMEKVN